MSAPPDLAAEALRLAAEMDATPRTHDIYDGGHLAATLRALAAENAALLLNCEDAEAEANGLHLVADNFRIERDTALARASELEARVKVLEGATPDMWWDADDAEHCEHDPRELAVYLGVEPGYLLHFQTAFRGPDMWGVVVATDDGDIDVQTFATEAEAEAARTALAGAAS